MYEYGKAFQFNSFSPVALPAGIIADGVPSDAMVSFYANGSDRIFGLDLVRDNLDDAARKIIDLSKRGSRSTVFFINAHCINTVLSDKEYNDALQSADMLLPDGSGLRLAAKLANRTVPHNLNGTDLFPEICKKAAKAGQKIYLLGGKPGVADECVSRMEAKYGEGLFAGCQDGYFDHEKTDDVIAAINASGASILLVGFGVPLQEKWVKAQREKINAPTVMAVGGLFDYYSGNIPRAPEMVRKLGCEWIWRLAQEPRRLAGRYIMGNAKFVMTAISYALLARGIRQNYIDASKRTLDLAIALMVLLLLGPVIAAICLLITAEDRGSPFFMQTRIGEDGKPFRMWKFRSMFKDAEARRAELLGQSERDGTCFKMKKDPRVTRIGSWLRRLSIDELPQLWNVVKGEMSIVGPRPALPSEVVVYPEAARGRLAGKPGLTCIWQVSGRADIPFEEQVMMDIEYLNRRSPLLDISLMLRTVPAVISGRGAY